ncbi:MAG: proton-conducting transporter membrane subunit [Treponemataceae bacterium]
MSSIVLVLIAIGVLAAGGIPACLQSSRSSAGQKISTALTIIGGGTGLYALVLSFGESTHATISEPWFLPFGRFAVAIDPLSVVFLALVFVVPVLGSIYGLGYWKQAEHPKNGQKLGFFYGLLAGSMGLVSIARDGVLFLIAWEIMALAAFFAATVEEENPEVRYAGWVYLIATHIGTLCLFAMFALWERGTGSFALEAAVSGTVPAAGAIFVLAVIGFGFKAGLMPLHVWLPGAHANAPSHVSAVMSGVMLKMGIYGILRMTSLLPVTAPWWGGTLLAVGAITGLAGIAFAIGQTDLKRLLAYSSIENIGVITMGIGLALLGRGAGRWEWILLGLGGALFHVWNHGLFKSLLFLNSGSIIHAVGTRNIEELGGLSKKLPTTAALFLIGAVAISALPPLNGFASEWLLYLGLFDTLGLDGKTALGGAAIAVPALAMIGALAVACFVKLFATVFLGASRSERIEHAHESGPAMLFPMIFLAGVCATIGFFPSLVLLPIENAVRVWAAPLSQQTTLGSLVSFNWVSTLGIVLVIMLGLIFTLLRFLAATRSNRAHGTWDCGYARPTNRMQYTGTSFVQSIVDLFFFILWPKRGKDTVRGVFPERAEFKTSVPDAVLDRLALPVFKLAERYAPNIRFFQQGQTHFYILYVFIITIVLLGIGAMGVNP